MTLENLAYLCGIIATISTGIYFVLGKINERKLYFRKKLTKKWTNEGCVTCRRRESHYMDLDLKTNLENGEISGLINIRNLETDQELKNISVLGKLKHRNGHIILCNVIQGGHYVEYGKIAIRISRYGKGLTWIRQTGDCEEIPTKTSLWPLNDE